MATPNPLEISIRLGLLSGEVTVDLALPRAPMRLSGLVPVARHLTNIVVRDSIERAQQQGKTITCGPGCGVCCQSLVPVSAPEVFSIVDHIIALEAAERDEVLARFEQTIEQIERPEAMPNLPETVRDPTGLDLPKLAADYFALSIPCPLLVDQSCGVHPQRPLVCRHYNVTTPAAWCANPLEHPIDHVAMPACMSPMLALVTAKLIGGKSELIPLGYALQWAEQHAELAFQRWPAFELLRMFLEAMGLPSNIAEQAETD